MHSLKRIGSLLLAGVMLTGILSGCKVVEIPEDAWFNSSSSSSSFVEELVELDAAVPIEEDSILYQDALNGARVYVAQNPDTTESLVYESSDGTRTRLYVSAQKRHILYPLFSDDGTQVAFMLSSMGAQIGTDAYLGELSTVSVADGNVAVHELYVRSYPDNPRGYSWHSSDTLFISSAMFGVANQTDCVGYFNITNDEMNNIVGGEHPVDYARQGVISPDGSLIVYSGYYESNSRYAHCVFDTETGETTYWYDRANTGMTDTVSGLAYTPFLDNEHILKTRSYKMYLDEDGNIIYDSTPEVEEELSEAPEVASDEANTLENEGVTSEAVDGAEDENADSEKSEERITVVNSIFLLDVLTGEQTLLLEHAYKPYLSKDRTKMYFHITMYSSIAEGTDLSSRVFCYDFETEEIEEVTETLGVTSSYDVMLLEQRLNGYEE